MLALLGFLMVAVFMYLIMSRRLSALVALIVVPVVFALISGFGSTEIGDMMLSGIKKIAPTGIMLLFAILYFGVMMDAGLFDPLIKKIVKIVKGDPLKVIVGTAILATLVALDGDGTTTYMITVTAMLPLYRKLGIRPMILAVVPMLALGVMNMTPWGGPTARVMSVLHMDVSEIFVPVIPAMIGGIAWVMIVACILGKQERKRLGIIEIADEDLQSLAGQEVAATDETAAMKRPRLIWFNLLLTVALMVGLITSFLPLPTMFMLAFAIALFINYPKMQDQKERIAAHAANALATVSMVFAAGIFTGILTETKMIDAMASTLVSWIPDSLGSHMPLLVALTSMPFTYFMSNDAYYFGIVPILANAAAAYGIDPAEIGRASILGQPLHVLSPLFAAQYLLIGMVGVDYAESQKFILKWAFGTSIVMIALALLTGVISF
ncbi:CitMHS family transporter [Brevibacillus porteri]|uniref:TRAP transporter large permease subunit n=1 Tax=Brevibacillus brevis TaxID=1393 RepID=A0A517I2A7_BREBE|nr:citrate:proton symporter [Brevibacillus brevis]QDS32974.1 TRAP transporter large permease subunit [Brevibacillus brevis]